MKCSVCGKEALTYYKNTVTDTIHCPFCWEKSPERQKIKEDAKASWVSKAILIMSIVIFISVLIFSILNGFLR